jgi:hypothetical protein
MRAIQIETYGNPVPEAHGTRLLASVLVPVGQTGYHHGDVRPPGTAGRRRHDLHPDRGYLQFRSGRRSDYESHTERR